MILRRQTEKVLAVKIPPAFTDCSITKINITDDFQHLHGFSTKDSLNVYMWNIYMLSTFSTYMEDWLCSNNYWLKNFTVPFWVHSNIPAVSTQKSLDCSCRFLHPWRTSGCPMKWQAPQSRVRLTFMLKGWVLFICQICYGCKTCDFCWNMVPLCAKIHQYSLGKQQSKKYLQEENATEFYLLLMHTSVTVKQLTYFQCWSFHWSG